MQEFEQNVNAYDEDEYIHLGVLIKNYLRYTRKRWYLFLLLIIGCPVAFFAYKKHQFVPQYEAKVYYSVVRSMDVTVDSVVASRIVNGLPAIVYTTDFRKDMQKAMGVEALPDGYEIVGEATESANLFNVTVRCHDPQMVNTMLEGFKIIFPGWTSKAMGSCTLNVTDQLECDGTVVNYWEKKKTVIYGFAGGCFIFFLIATMKLMFVHKIHDNNELYQIAEAPCLGVLPYVRKKRRAQSTKETLLIDHENINRTYLQALRSLRNRVDYLMSKENQHIFLITSTLPEEGKSLITLNLAISFAQHGKEVYVIDGDMRQSGISRMLQIEEGTTGLSDYIKKKGMVDSYSINYQGVNIIPVGTQADRVAGTVKMRRMERLFKELEGKADVILIDSPPADYFGDVILFSDYADGVLYVVRGDYAEVGKIRKGVEPFYQQHKLAGYILNRINQNSSGFGYGYGYSRYRNYGRYSPYGERYGGKYTKYNKKKPDSVREVSEKEDQAMEAYTENAEEMLILEETMEDGGQMQENQTHVVDTTESTDLDHKMDQGAEETSESVEETEILELV